MLTIVIIELAFAFSVGLVCVIFSLNLFMSLKESQDSTSLQHLTAGDLPRPKSTFLNHLTEDATLLILFAE